MRTTIGNAFGPGRKVDVCPVCGVCVLVPYEGEGEWPEPHVHGTDAARMRAVADAAYRRLTGRTPTT